jgi:very-short-patch-repair endonuclease
MVDMRKRFGKRTSEPPPALRATSPLKGEVRFSTSVPHSRTSGNDEAFGSVPPPQGGRSREARVGVTTDNQMIHKPLGGVKPFTRQTQEYAQGLRKTMTDAEYALWYYLRGEQLGVKFRRQQPIGKYIVDFVCMDAKLVIEVDGGQHNESQYDKARDAFLRQEGFRVLRFWNNEVLENIEGVYMRIQEALRECQSEPPPGLRPTSPLEGEVRSAPELTSPFRGEVARSAGGGQA